jgi:hypothetical protein
MPQVDYEISQTGEHVSTKFTDEGKKKEKRMEFKGVDENTGIVVRLSIAGPPDIIDKEFLTFPTGTGSGVDWKVNLLCNQKTLTSSVAAATKSVDPKKGKSLDDTLAEIDKI